LVRAAIAEHGAPEFIRSDNGPEFIAKDLQPVLDTSVTPPPFFPSQP